MKQFTLLFLARGYEIGFKGEKLRIDNALKNKSLSWYIGKMHNNFSGIVQMETT